MELRREIGELVADSRELLARLRSADEGPTIEDVDLHILRVQLSLLDIEMANMQELRRIGSGKLNTRQDDTLQEGFDTGGLSPS